MLTKQYTVALLFPFFFTFMRGSDGDFVTPVGAAKPDIREADTVILSKAPNMKKYTYGDMQDAKRNLGNTFDTADQESHGLITETKNDTVQPWPDQTPSTLRGVTKTLIVSRVQDARGKVGNIRTGPLDSLINLCKATPGNGEWALYYTIVLDASDVCNKILDLGYSCRVFFPLDGKKPFSDEPIWVEGLLIAALRLKKLEHARILIDSVGHFSFFSEQVERSSLSEDDWNRVAESLEELHGEAQKLKDEDLLQLCLYLDDLIKRKRQGAIRYYSASIYKSIRQDLYAAVGTGKRLAGKALTYAPFIGLAGLIVALFVRDMRSVYVRNLNMLQLRIFAEASSSCCDITDYT